MIKLQKTNKYGNRKRTYNGMKFDSGRELKRYQELELLHRAGKISNLRRQVPFELIPTQRDANGRVVENCCRYFADFVYEENGMPVVEDTKGYVTKDYLIKRKLMLWKYGIRIREV